MYSVACCLRCYCRVTYGSDSIRMKLALDNPSDYTQPSPRLSLPPRCRSPATGTPRVAPATASSRGGLRVGAAPLHPLSWVGLFLEPTGAPAPWFPGQGLGMSPKRAPAPFLTRLHQAGKWFLYRRGIQGLVFLLFCPLVLLYSVHQVRNVLKTEGFCLLGGSGLGEEMGGFVTAALWCTQQPAPRGAPRLQLRAWGAGGCLLQLEGFWLPQLPSVL